MVTKLVLIIEDNVDARMIYGAILNYDGYHIMEAENGELGVAAAKKHIPALILMDIMMPVMNGFAAASAIRAAPATEHVPIIAVTGNWFTNAEEDLLNTLFDGYLAKPITPTRVLREVQRLIGPPHS